MQMMKKGRVLGGEGVNGVLRSRNNQRRKSNNTCEAQPCIYIASLAGPDDFRSEETYY